MTYQPADWNPRLIVALDYPRLDDCRSLVEQLDPSLCRLKVGKELFTAAGPQAVEYLQQRGFEVFLDLKFHDIPATVAKAVAAAAELGVWMVNVHVSGGMRMLQAAKEALAAYARPPLLIGVTVLTSSTQEDLTAVGIQRPLIQQVAELAALAKHAGLDGVVCSAQEASLLREQLGDRFVLVTPGIRPAQAAEDDQKRIVTPEMAIQLGSHYLVVGRPITQSADPAGVCRSLALTISQAAGGAV